MRCDGISDAGQCCGNAPTHLLEWSDRRWWVCDSHLPQAYEGYDGDHDYDKTGISHTDLRTGKVSYEDR